MSTERVTDRPYTYMDWLDGPGLVEWLVGRGINFGLLGKNSTEAFQLVRWGAGGRADVYAVDKLLVRCGFHLSDLPDELWTERGLQLPGGRQIIRSEDFKRRVALARQSAGPREVAERFGISTRSVRKWAGLYG